jgi:hypothetical protein
MVMNLKQHDNRENMEHTKKIIQQRVLKIVGKSRDITRTITVHQEHFNLNMILTNKMIVDSAHPDSIFEIIITVHISAAGVIPCIQYFGFLFP